MDGSSRKIGPLFIGSEIYRGSRYGPRHPLRVPRVSTVIDLSRAIGERPLEDPNGGCLIVTDISRTKQGLHVQAVSKIVHCLSTDIKPPPFGSGNRSFITGVTRVDNTLVQVLDIEKVIHAIAPAPAEPLPGELGEEDASLLAAANILVVDDSQVALQQSVHTLRGLGIEAPNPFAKPGPEERPTRIAHDVPGRGRTEVRIDSGAARAALGQEEGGHVVA